MADESAETVPPIETAAVSWEERHLAPPLRQVNQVCENWIFAFIVAMAIRHFCIEAYSIPTASMEPMLYGDPGFLQGDHVVVDKALFRFTGPRRWGVTVFQFPWPEVGPPNKPSRAWDDEGRPLGSFPLDPLLHRNFVKRALVLPGDEFFISGGDLYLRDGDGWSVPRKPDRVQEALWQPIYRHGAQTGYLPWRAGTGGSAALAGEDGTLQFVLAGDDGLRFDQPLRNLYVKPGQVNVQLKRAFGRSGGDQPLQRVQVSMLEPQFSYREPDGSQRIGSIWDLDTWEVMRLTSADLDHGSHGTHVNQRMTEWVGDLRWTIQPGTIEGEVDFVLRQGDAVAIALQLRAEAWSFVVDGRDISTGVSPLHSRWQLVNLDNRAELWRDGERVAGPVPVAATDPSQPDQRTRLEVIGRGRVDLMTCALERDLHLCSSGFLADERGAMRPDRAVDPGRRHLSGHERHGLILARRQFVSALSDEALRTRLLAQIEAATAWRDLGDDWLRPIGDAPERALVAPPDGYLMLGDNSPFSWDGRNWGWVPVTNLRGSVLAVVLPFARWRVVR